MAVSPPLCRPAPFPQHNHSARSGRGLRVARPGGLALVRWLLMLAAAALLAAPAAMAEDPCVEGEVIVTFKRAVSDASAQGALRRRSLGFDRKFSRLSRTRGHIVGVVRQPGRRTQDLIADLKTDDSIEAAEPNYLRRVSALAPNDPGFAQLWGLENTGQSVNGLAGTLGADIAFRAAWQMARAPEQEIVVAVADTGLDITHPDLAGNIWTNPAEIAGNGLDDDGNGRIDDVHGYDFADDTPAMTDSGSHGTHVAGTIAATGNNGAGIIGVQPYAKIIPLKVSSDGDTMATSALLDAFEYLIQLKEKGVNIVALNASYGGSSSTTAERRSIEALEAAGIILCAAAGNDGDDLSLRSNYPASYASENILSVAAIGQNGELALWSNYDHEAVDLAAPGENIYSTLPLNQALRTSLSVQGASYEAAAIQYAGITDGPGGLTGGLIHCGLGYPENFPAEVAGQIALISRGTLTFAEKVQNAQAAGATAAVIYNHVDEGEPLGNWTLGGEGGWIPALEISQSDGEALRALLPAAATLVNGPDLTAAYVFEDGTSMATPHVAGAVAFAALNFPGDTMAQRRARILASVTPSASLASTTATGGYLNLRGIVDADNDTLPDWWESQYAPSLALEAADDPDHDGISNAVEYLAQTHPSDAASTPGFTFFARSGQDGAHVTLGFPTVPALSYQVECSLSLESGHWQPLHAASPGNGATLQVTDFNAWPAATHKYYRLSISRN